MHPWIVSDPQIRFGKPCVKGTRISVGEILEALAAGQSPSDIQADFPQLGIETIQACLSYAAARERSSSFLNLALH